MPSPEIQDLKNITLKIVLALLMLCIEITFAGAENEDDGNQGGETRENY
jgi:hypothetical protein